MLAAEVDPEVYSDARLARMLLETIDGYDDAVIDAHIAYLNARLMKVIHWHHRAICVIAARLYADTTMSGSEVERVVKSFRCPCHAEWQTRRKV